MKRIILLAALCLSSLAAKGVGPEIMVSRAQITVTDQSVFVRFNVLVGRRAVRGSDILIYTPRITDGDAHWALPEIVVRRRSGKIAAQRRVWVSGRELPLDHVVSAANSEMLSYTARVPRQEWMSRARLEAETVVIGCCEQTAPRSEFLASVPDFTPPAPEPTTVVLVPAEPSPSTGERLSQAVDWVRPDTELDRSAFRQMFERDREGSLSVLFPLDSSVLDRNRDNNGQVLDLLVATLREIERSSDSRVTGIVVAGYASPEGPWQHNEQLAARRVEVLRQYLAANTPMSADKIFVYNGAEDWAGLRRLVEASAMPGREAVLGVMDNTWSDVAGREQMLKRLDGGAPYRYMSRYFFPRLRQAAYIKVFYENN